MICCASGDALSSLRLLSAATCSGLVPPSCTTSQPTVASELASAANAAALPPTASRFSVRMATLNVHRVAGWMRGVAGWIHGVPAWIGRAGGRLGCLLVDATRQLNERAQRAAGECGVGRALLSEVAQRVHRLL